MGRGGGDRVEAEEHLNVGMEDKQGTDGAFIPTRGREKSRNSLCYP